MKEFLSWLTAGVALAAFFAIIVLVLQERGDCRARGGVPINAHGDVLCVNPDRVWK